MIEIESEDTFLKGPGVAEHLPTTTQDDPAMFLPLVEGMNDVLDVIDQINFQTQTYLEEVLPFAGIEPENATHQIENGRWIIYSRNDLNKYPLAMLFPAKELIQLNRYPYLLASGNQAAIVGLPTQNWLDGKTSVYNSITGLAVQPKNTDGGLPWYVTLTQININSEPTRPELIPGITEDQLVNSTDNYYIGPSTGLNGNRNTYLDSVLDRVTNTRWQIFEKSELWSNYFNRSMSGESLFNMSALASMIGDTINGFMPWNLFSMASGLMNKLLEIKDSILCFAECSISMAINLAKSAAEAAKSLVGMTGIIKGGTDYTQVKITVPDLEMLSDCFNLDWLLNLLMGLLGALLGILKGIWDLLKKIFSWPDCNCADLFGLGDAGLDICGFGIKTEKKTVEDDQAVGPLDRISIQIGTDEAQTLSEFRNKKDWSPDGVLDAGQKLASNAVSKVTSSVSGAISKGGDMIGGAIDDIVG